MIKNLKELWRYRSLLYAITYRDVRIRYKQSIMGFMWAILMPLIIVLVGIIVRFAYSLASGAELDPEGVAGVAIRATPWAFAVSAIRFGSTSLAGNASLVTKIYFPKEIFPMAAVASSLFDMLIASVPLAIFVGFLGAHLGLSLLWIPALILVEIVIITGIVLFTSAAGLFFRDVKYLVEISLTFGIFVTPVFLTTAMFGDYGVWMMFNPLSSIFEGLDSVAIQGVQPDIAWLGYSLSIGLLMLIGGYSFFKRLEPAFAESI